MAESEEQVLKEIEAVRRKIAENERLLSRVKMPPTETEEAQAPAVEDELNGPDGGEEGCGYYVYGTVVSDSSQPIEGLPGKGVDPAQPVYALPYQAIQAIVSKVSLQEFGPEPMEANLNDLHWLEAKVRAHQGVLETVLANHTLIPMRFCTIYRSEGRVQEMLAQHYDDFVEALTRLKGKQEWGVKVYCDRETLAHKVGEVSHKVRELKTEMAEKSEGAAYFVRKRLEQATVKEVETVSDECAQRTHDRLSSRAKRAVINSLQSSEITGRKKVMILNGAYLVAEERLAAFRAELESMEEEYGNLGFSYEMTGPWPAYNFVAIGSEGSVADE